MTKVSESGNFSNVTTTEGVVRWASRFAQQAQQILNGLLEFDVNLRTTTVLGVLFGTNDTDLVITHKLNRMPKGYIVASQDAAGSIYKSPIAFTNLTVTLRCSVSAVTATIIVF